MNFQDIPGTDTYFVPDRSRKYQIGETVRYRLKPADRPINPSKIWRGRIFRIHYDPIFPSLITGFRVLCLEPSYENEEEVVTIDQVVE